MISDRAYWATLIGAATIVSALIAVADYSERPHFWSAAKTTVKIASPPEGRLGTDALRPTTISANSDTRPRITDDEGPTPSSVNSSEAPPASGKPADKNGQLVHISEPETAEVSHPKIAADSRATDPAILGNCSGLYPLTLTGIQATPRRGGYHVIMQLANPTDHDVALLSEPAFNSSDDNNHSGNGGDSSLRIISLNNEMIMQTQNQSRTEPDALREIFKKGQNIDAGQNGSIGFDFSEGINGSEWGTSLSFNVSLDAILRGPTGTYSQRINPVGCRDIPVRVK